MLYFWQKQLTYNKIQLTIWQRGCQIKNCLSNISYLSSPKMRTNCGHAAQNKNPKHLVCKCLGFFTGTRSRGRTGTDHLHWCLRPTRLPIPPSGRALKMFRACKYMYFFPFSKKYRSEFLFAYCFAPKLIHQKCMQSLPANITAENTT